MNPRKNPTDAPPGRFAQFRTQLLRPFPIVAAIVILIVAVVGGAAPAEAVFGALLVFVLVAVGALKRSSRDAREVFFARYANSRGLDEQSDEDLPAVTPLLHMGDRRYAGRVMSGVLPGGINGTLAHFSYEEARDADGNERGQTHRFTVVICWLPAVTDKVLELYCEPRLAPRSLSGIEGFRMKNRLQLESVALDKRYDIFFGPDDDENWLHRLCVPTFIVWLAESAPADFAFQFTYGHLCAFAPGHQDNAVQLDALCEAAAVVSTRLVEEAAE